MVHFFEKPDAATAGAYVAAGLLWNSGNFFFQPETFLAELEAYAPALWGAAEAAVAGAAWSDGLIRLGPAFLDAPAISIDYALMERTRRAAVAPVGFGWSDMGAWDAIWAASDKDSQGNAVAGPVRLMETRDCLVDAGSGPTVVTIGLTGMGVIVRPEGVLVCDLGRSQEVKAATAGLPGAATQAGDPVAEAADGLKRWLFTSALPLWWSLGYDHAGGGFHEALDMDARPVPGRRRVRVQARQIYTFATAGLLGWPGPWPKAVVSGLEFMTDRYRLPNGLFRDQLEPDGQSVDDTASSYEQAFAILALATAAQALPDQRDTLLALTSGG